MRRRSCRYSRLFAKGLLPSRAYSACASVYRARPWHIVWAAIWHLASRPFTAEISALRVSISPKYASNQHKRFCIGIGDAMALAIAGGHAVARLHRHFTPLSLTTPAPERM